MFKSPTPIHMFFHPAGETEKANTDLKGSARRGAGVKAGTRGKPAGKATGKRKPPLIAEKYVALIRCVVLHQRDVITWFNFSIGRERGLCLEQN